MEPAVRDTSDIMSIGSDAESDSVTLEAVLPPQAGFMEIFSPPRVALRLPAGLTSAGSFDIITGSDLTTWQGQRTVLEAFNTFRPRMLVSSPPCTMYSDLQRLWNFKRMKASVCRARMKEANTLLDFGMTMCVLQGKAGRFWVHEHPNRASSWKRRTVP